MSNTPINQFHLVSAQSMGASFNSPAQHIQFQDNIGIQINWTGTPNGAFTVQTSVDHVQDSQGNVLTAGNWVTLVLSASITASGSADQAYIDLNQLSAPYFRVVYTRSSSTGTCDVYINAKGI